MIPYRHEIEQFRDYVDFTYNDPCIWVVYPPGGAGDMLSALINYHYVNTGSKYFGINANGQVIFRPTDNKITNSRKMQSLIEFDNAFLCQIVDALSEKHLNYSNLDQIIFSNHYYRNSDILNIIKIFTKSKIIRILPRTNHEKKVIDWLSNFKNLNILNTAIEHDENTIELSTDDYVKDPKILDIFFGQLLNPVQFEIVYNQIINHLELSGPLIRFNFIEFYISKQSPVILPSFDHIRKYYD